MDLLVRGLAVWRLSEMLVEERGPGDVFLKLRAKTGVTGLGNTPFIWNHWTPLGCIYCTSIWVGIALWILPKWVSTPLALSAVAVLLKDGSDKWL